MTVVSGENVWSFGISGLSVYLAMWKTRLHCGSWRNGRTRQSCHVLTRLWSAHPTWLSILYGRPSGHSTLTLPVFPPRHVRSIPNVRVRPLRDGPEIDLQSDLTKHETRELLEMMRSGKAPDVLVTLGYDRSWRNRFREDARSER